MLVNKKPEDDIETKPVVEKVVVNENTGVETAM